MLSKKLLVHKTRSHVKKNQTPRLTLPYKKAESAGVIFSTEDLEKHNTIKGFVNKLKADGKEVTVLTFLPRDRHNFEFKFDFFTAEDFSVFGNHTSKDALNFAKQPFDYLFYIDQEPNPFIENLVAMSKAKCRVGKYSRLSDQDLFEFMISTKEKSTTQELADEMYRYTKILE